MKCYENVDIAGLHHHVACQWKDRKDSSDGHTGCSSSVVPALPAFCLPHCCGRYVVPTLPAFCLPYCCGRQVVPESLNGKLELLIRSIPMYMK